jgi:hypothetical protein
MPSFNSRRRTARAGFIEPWLPSPADNPPSGANWIHEIKHDGGSRRMSVPSSSSRSKAYRKALHRTIEMLRPEPAKIGGRAANFVDAPACAPRARSDRVASLEEAKDQFKTSREAWKVWANLEEPD